MHDKSYKILHCFCNLGIIETVEVGIFYECWDTPYVIAKKSDNTRCHIFIILCILQHI